MKIKKPELYLFTKNMQDKFIIKKAEDDKHKFEVLYFNKKSKRWNTIKFGA
jgi:hypothetical protein